AAPQNGFDALLAPNIQFEFDVVLRGRIDFLWRIEIVPHHFARGAGGRHGTTQCALVLGRRHSGYVMSEQPRASAAVARPSNSNPVSCRSARSSVWIASTERTFAK